MTIQANTSILPYSSYTISSYQPRRSPAVLPKFLQTKQQSMNDLLPSLLSDDSESLDQPTQPTLVESSEVLPQPTLQWRTRLDKALIGIELLAVLGFLFMGIKFSRVTFTLNREVEALQDMSLAVLDAELPAFSQTSADFMPAPSSSNIIDKRSVPLSPARVNQTAELQNNLPTLSAATLTDWTNNIELAEPPPFEAESTIPFVLPKPKNAGMARRIQIPALNIDKPILAGDSWEQLKLGVGHYPSSANPGQIGNMVLSAHNDVYGQIFRHLDDLKPGDEIRIATAEKWYIYVVREINYVSPTETWVLSPTDNATATLVSCYPYLVNNKRIVVFADLLTDSG